MLGILVAAVVCVGQAGTVQVVDVDGHRNFVQGRLVPCDGMASERSDHEKVATVLAPDAEEESLRMDDTFARLNASLRVEVGHSVLLLGGECQNDYTISSPADAGFGADDIACPDGLECFYEPRLSRAESRRRGYEVYRFYVKAPCSSPS